MSSDYWLGLATIPVVLVLLALGVVLYALLFERSSWDSVGCRRCDWEHNTKGNPRWLSALKVQIHHATHWRGTTK